MTNPSPGLPHPVRRVSPTSPNSAAITSSMLPIPMRRVIPDRRTGSELLRLPRTVQPMRRVSRTVQTNAASSPLTATQETSFLLLSRTVRRVSTTATQGASHPSCFPDRKAGRRVVLRPSSGSELLRLSRTVQTYAASYSPRIATSSAASPLMHPRTVGENLLFP